MLYVVPTPIWNRWDITLRALELLTSVEVFFCEDKRVLQKLFRLYDIDRRNKKLYTLTSFSSEWQQSYYMNLIHEFDCVQMSDAWTPGLSDPWKQLIKLCWEWNYPFEVLPWATALIPAVVASYCDTSKFVYMWFPPTKKGRETFFKKIIASDLPVYIYESVHRVEKTLKQLKKLWFTWLVFMSREISKMHEQKTYWSLDDMLKKIENWEIVMKWEFVLWFLSSINE